MPRSRKRGRTKWPKYRHDYRSNAYEALSPDTKRVVRRADSASSYRTERPARSQGIERVAFAQCGKCLSPDVYWVRVSTLNRYDGQSAAVYRKAKELGVLHGAVRQCLTCNELWNLRQAKRPKAVVRASNWRRETDDNPDMLVTYESQGALLKPKMRLDL